MTFRNWRIAVALTVAALVGGVAIQAQELHNAKVPFAFEVAGQKMQPGPYRAIFDSHGALTIENSATSQKVYLMPLPLQPGDSEKSSLTFRCYSGQCFLSNVAFGQTEMVYGIPKTKHEKEVAATQPPETVLVAMR
jgi:hypothetical protein